MNFVKFLEKLFCRTSLSNHFSHDVVFFLCADQRGLQPKISLFGGAMIIWSDKFTTPFNTVYSGAPNNKRGWNNGGVGHCNNY